MFPNCGRKPTDDFTRVSYRLRAVSREWKIDRNYLNHTALFLGIIISQLVLFDLGKLSFKKTCPIHAIVHFSSEWQTLPMHPS